MLRLWKRVLVLLAAAAIAVVPRPVKAQDVEAAAPREEASPQPQVEPSPQPQVEPSPQPQEEPSAQPPAEAEGPKEEPPAGPPPPHTGVKATLRAIPGDFAHLPSRASLWILLGGSALTAAVSPFDKDVNDRLTGSSAVHNFFAPGKVIGQSWFIIGGSLAVYGIGRATDHRHASHLGMDLIRAEIETGAITFAIKFAVNRERPNGGSYSFPSGHASATFAATTVLWRHLGWKAALPSYLVATYVATSRLHENVHYLSDVVAGATIGTIVGHTVTRHGRSNFAVFPYPVRGGMGVSVVLLPRRKAPPS